MRAVVQRVTWAGVEVDGQPLAGIGRGFLILLGVGQGDGEDEAAWLANKIGCLRVFPDAEGKMSLALAEVGGASLVVPQFTLYANTADGNRPDFLQAAKPELAQPLWERFCDLLKQSSGRPVQRGRFGADMQVSLLNNGPVTVLYDTAQR